MTEIACASHLVKRFGRGEASVEALRGISFSVQRGTVVGLLGRNGAGKTTTLRLLLGFLRPSSGLVRIFDASPTDAAVRARIGYQPDRFCPFPFLSGRSTLVFFGRLAGMRKAEAAAQADSLLQRLGLRESAHRPVRTYSHGMLQRLGLAQALVADPEILILDEPSSGLDPTARREVRELLVEERNRGRTVLLSSHILSDVERICDSVLVLEKGKVIFDGPTQQLASKSADLEDSYLDLVGATE